MYSNIHKSWVAWWYIHHPDQERTFPASQKAPSLPIPVNTSPKVTSIFFKRTIVKAFIEFVTVLLLLYVLVFLTTEACGILALQPGIIPAPSALEGEDLTTGPPEKSQVASNLTSITMD